MKKGNVQLTLQTSSLVVGFMVWVILSSLMSFINQDIALTPTQATWVTAVPVILGSILRVPIGYWTNVFGARYLFLASLILLLFPVFYLSTADSFFDLILGGFFIGIGGATFSIGVTSLPKYYPKEKQGLINGIYGVGNVGTAISTFAAPIIAEAFGWRMTIRFYLILLIVFALLVFLFGDRKEEKNVTPLMEQIKSVYRNSTLWFLSIFYFLTFGSFVAFTVYLPNFLVSHFGLTEVDAGMRTAGFIALATFIRPVGGWLGDRFNPYRVLMILFAGLTVAGIILSFSPDIVLYTFGTLLVAVCAGIGNGTIFKLVPLYFSKQSGIVNGIVAAMGGLGGFFPPLVLTSVFEITGHYAIGFMALSQVALASLIIVIFMYYTGKLTAANDIIHHSGQGIMVTDGKGVIQRVNPAFTEVTGYEAEEAIGETPRLLHSGKHDENFYKDMWEDIRENGFWQGEIWNKRKNGEIYREWLTISTIKDETGEENYYAGMFTEIPKDE
ncbi:MFS transporter [Virgibacillus sp. MSP4-1]|uniref:nitrate/nitrite transporter n=1 Tax=Virgibacillus sp. MSP4-1 TaxID=2700081 RepID=UPI0003999B01|nr:nitrate/nitrite transporter [Virgibacillus sp. MSP4-1]QHS21964.1 MFS transporter [Virgibacillus sp. MSP4-1]